MNTLLLLAICIAIPMTVGFLNGIATARSIDTWYVHLDKPSWNPPNWVFAPVWTVLYIMMGTALWLVIRDGFGAPGVVTATIAFAVQMTFNAAWSPVFFLLRDPARALLVVIALDISVVATIVLFAQHSLLAAALLVPYLGWGLFATALTAVISQRNPGGQPA